MNRIFRIVVLRGLSHSVFNLKNGRGGASCRRPMGFSLIEIMIAVALVGIIAAIAIPNYSSYVQRSARTDAKSLLLESTQLMERYFTTNNTYVGATLPNTVSPKNASGNTIRYNISFTADPTPGGYTVQAEPVNAQASDSCGTLSISNTGAQTPTTTGCW